MLLLCIHIEADVVPTHIDDMYVGMHGMCRYGDESQCS
jgi:hypothetical protein